MIQVNKWQGVIRYHIADSEESQHHIEPKNSMVIPFSSQAQFLTLKDVIFHLKADGVKEESIKQIKLYQKEFKAYVQLNDYSTILLTEKASIDLQIEVRFHPEEEQSQFVKKYSTIFSRIQSIKAKFSSLMASESEHPRKERASNSSEALQLPSSFDIGILYANPIVFVDPCKKIQAKKNDLIDYETELEQFIALLEKVKKEVRVRIEIANLENIIDVIRKRPKILHLTCHGSFQIENCEEVFALNLEDQLGRLYKYSITDFKNLFKLSSKELEPIDVIFLSACHSESIANVFLETQAKCVICVNAKTKILDEAAQNFARRFYQHLLEGKTVSEAFKSSKTIVKSEGDECCCCSHLHKEHCKTKNNHSLHVKTCNCTMKDNMHHLGCGWAKSRMQTFGYLSLAVSDDLIRLCCCSPEIAHNEGLKFIMLVNPQYPSIINQVLFPSSSTGKMTIVNANCCLNYPFYSKLKTGLLGRNLELYDIIAYFNDQKNTKRTVTIHNEVSIGKKAFVRFVVKYLFERKMFPDGIYHISFEGMNSDQESIIQRIVSSVDNETNYESFDNFALALTQSKMLLIVDMTSLKREQLGPYVALLRKFIELTVKPKLILIALWQVDIEENSKSILLERVSNEDILQLLLYVVDNGKLPKSLLKQPNEFVKHRVITWCSGIPSRVYLIKNMLEEDKFEVVANKLTQMKETERTLINEVVKQYMSSKEKVKELILMLSIVRSGILKEDIIELYGSDSWRSIEKQTILYISHNSGITSAINPSEQKRIYQLDRVFCSRVAYPDFRDNGRVCKGMINLFIFYSKRLRQIVKCYQKKLLFNPQELSALNEGLWQSLRAAPSQEVIVNSREEKTIDAKVELKTIEVSPIGDDCGTDEEKEEEDYLDESNLYNKNSSIITNHTVNSKDNKEQRRELMQEAEVDLFKLFTLYYKSIMCLMKTDLISKKSLEPFASEPFLEAIEEISICLPTLLKINQKIKDCIDKVGLFKGLCEDYNLFRAKARLCLFETQFNKGSKDKLISQAIQLAQEDPECLAEAYYANGILNDAIDSSHECTLKLLKQAHDAQGVSSMIKLRAALAISDYIIKNRLTKGDYANEVINCLLSIATAIKNAWFICRGLINRAKMKLKEKDYIKAQETCRECSKAIDSIQSSNEKEQMQTELNRVKYDIFSQSKDESKNVFRFLMKESQSFDAIKPKRKASFEHSPDRITHQTFENNKQRPSLFLKELMIDAFHSMNKQIIVEFNSISNESLALALQSSGKLLYIGSDSCSMSKNILIKGDTQLAIEAIIKEKSIARINYDLIILGFPNSIHLYETFKQCQVKHIVTFDFPKAVTDQSSVLLGQTVIDLIESFTCDFISNSLLKTNTIASAFQSSSIQLSTDHVNICAKLKQLLGLSFNWKVFDEVKSWGRPVAYLFPKDVDHCIGLLSTKESWQSGQMEDISKPQGLIYNEDASNNSFLGNEAQLFMTLALIKKHFVLNVYGCEGIGRKRFLIELITKLREEGLFLNGFFFFDIAEVDSIEALKEFFQKKTGFFNLLNRLNEDMSLCKADSASIKEKILILILNANSLSPNYLLQFFNSKMYQKHCRIIIDSAKRLDRQSLKSVCIRKLNRLQSSVLFLFFLERTLEDEDFTNDKEVNVKLNANSIKSIRHQLSSIDNLMTNLFRSKAIKQCKGLPQNIKRLGTQARSVRIKSLSYHNLLTNRNEELNDSLIDYSETKKDRTDNSQGQFWSMLNSYLFDMGSSTDSTNEAIIKRLNLSFMHLLKDKKPLNSQSSIEPYIIQQTTQSHPSLN